MTFESDKNANSKNKKPEYQPGSAIALCMPLGAGFGVAMGVAFNNIALGIPIGTAIGGAIGTVMEQKRKGIDVENDKKTATTIAVSNGAGHFNIPCRCRSLSVFTDEVAAEIMRVVIFIITFIIIDKAIIPMYNSTLIKCNLKLNFNY